MSLASGKKLSIGEWLVVFGLTALAVAVTEFIGVGQKWENAIVYTVIVFTAVIIPLRPAWGRSGFWPSLIGILLLHCIAIVVIEQSLPPSSAGPHGLPLVVAGMAEAVIVGSVLWKRSMKSNSHSS
jgi:hypothetical protein